MKQTSFVLTLLTTLLLVSCTATPSPTTMATTHPDNSLTPVTTIIPIESPLLTPTLTASVPALTPTLPPVTSLPAETPTIAPTHNSAFRPWFGHFYPNAQVESNSARTRIRDRQ